MLYSFSRGKKMFELPNHLGNVLATLSDKKYGTPGAVPSQVSYYTADVKAAQDYYPFGMQMPGRSPTGSNPYRFGFNGKENDNEVKGQGNQQDYGMRIYDPRLGRFLSRDTVTNKYPWYTPFQYAGNIPIAMIDLDGLEEVNPTIDFDPNLQMGSVSYPVLKPSQWKVADRASASGTFATAATYNTNTLNSSVYKPVVQIHQYYVWAASEIDKTKSNIKFFHAAREVTGLLGVDGAYSFSTILSLSEEGRKSLADVNSRLLQENISVVKDLITSGSSSIVNGKGITFDFNYVNREQTFVTEVLNKNPLSESDARAINNTFKAFEFIHAEYSLAKALLGASSIDYKNKTHRVAIGRSLVFIEHFLKMNDYQKASQTKEFQTGVNYLKQEYGEKNTQNFLNLYKEKLGQ